MKQQGLAFFTDIHFTVIGLLIFMIFFAAVVFFAYRKSAKEHYQEMANLPLEEGGSNE